MPRTLLAVLLCAVPCTAADPPTWTQWRGPHRDGSVDPGKPWPDALKGDALSVVWKADNLGPSYSGPIVSADRVFTTETVNKKTEVVTAFDRKTGKVAWKQQWDGAMTVPFFAAKNGSWIRSTPAFDGETLYVAGIRDVLVALDAKTGDIRWKLDFVTELKSPPPDFGFVCSPLVDDTAVYVQAAGSFAKVDKKTGKILWRSLSDGGGMMGSAFSSPAFASFADRKVILVQTRTKLAAVDPATGKALFEREVPSFRGMNILTPITVGNGVFTSTYGGNTQLVKIEASGDGLRAADGWAFKYEGNMSTPVVVGTHAYLLGKDRRLICVDLTAGKPAWRSEKSFGEYWSLVANRDKILALDQKGILYLLKANSKELEILDERKVADDAWAHLAVAGDEVIVRSLDGLAVYGWK